VLAAELERYAAIYHLRKTVKRELVGIFCIAAFVLLGCQRSLLRSAGSVVPVNHGTLQNSSGLVGSWRILRFCTADSAGRRFEVFGERPAGHFIFDPSGFLSIQIFRTPAGAPAPTEALTDPLFSADERRMFRDGYLGMFGPYTITSDSTFFYHVDGGSLPTYTGTQQKRTYQIVGQQRDTLTMGSTGCRILVRVG